MKKKYNPDFIKRVIDYCVCHTNEKAATDLDLSPGVLRHILRKNDAKIRMKKEARNEQIFNQLYHKHSTCDFLQITGWSKTKFIKLREKYLNPHVVMTELKMISENPRLAANLLPVNTWFTRHEFSDITGIEKNKCPEALKKMVDRKLLTCYYSRGKTSKYKMTEQQQATMLSGAHKDEVNVVCTDDARKRHALDVLLFSTKFF